MGVVHLPQAQDEGSVGSLQEGPRFREVVQLVSEERGQDSSTPLADPRTSGLKPEFSALALLIFGGPDRSLFAGLSRTGR